MKTCFSLIFAFLLLTCAVGSEVRDFKVALMYYSEAYLQGATLGGLKLEGEHSEYVAEKIYTAIKNLNIENWTEEPWKSLKNFGKLLEAGNDIGRRITDSSYFGGLNEHNIMAEAARLQDHMLSLIKENDGIIMPSGWKGHAIVLIIKPGEHVDTYDMTVVNTGDGIGYHYHDADPNGIYPLLSRVWVEFKGIPEDLLFPKDAWFLQGLIALRWEKFVDKVKAFIKGDDESLSIYYYTSFLVNFEKYLVPVSKGKNRQIPMQRSGSCTISSILGALLYESANEKDFHLFRNKIGNNLINEVLKTAETNIELIRIVSDGFDANGRIFMKGFLSSMAHNVLQYLEAAMPKEFEHAGLIGSNRSIWLYENKQNAIKALNNNKEALKLIADTIKTSNAVINFLDAHRVRKNSTLIEVKAVSLKRLNACKASEGSGELILTMDKRFLDSDPNEFIRGSPDRPALKILNFNDFSKAFEDAVNADGSKVLFIVLDIFKANKNWRSLVDGAHANDLLKIQVNVGKIVKSYITASTSLAFDDIVALLLLQKLVWKCTVIFNKNAVPEKKMCETTYDLEALFPNTLENILIHRNYEYLTFSNDIRNWRFHNIFDPSTVKLFIELLKDYQTYKGNKALLFDGPEKYSSPEDACLTFPALNPQSISKIQHHPIVVNSLTSFINHPDLHIRSYWKSKNEFAAKLEIVLFIEKDQLITFFPHFYLLMDTLAIMQSALVGKVPKLEHNYWISIDQNGHYRNSYAVPFSVIDIIPDNPLDIMSKGWNLKAPYKAECKTPASEMDIFYRFRHSNALTSDLNVTNYQVWLNYIKDINNARIFDSAYFQYITDHLLNNPNNYLDFHYNFKHFEPKLAIEIIDEMTKLIGLSLQRLKDDKDQNLTVQKRKTLVLRAANISILITRFIGLMDAQNVLVGETCAKKLAEIYKMLQPYSELVSKYKLTDIEVSYINFAMFYTCSVSIRNNKHFMDNLDFTPYAGDKLRKTLEKFHWFIANSNFISNGSLMGVIYDQFNYGIAGNPLKEDETAFLMHLLALDFIPSKCGIDAPNMTVFKFRSDGFIVEIHSSKLEDKDKKYLLINLAKGTIVSDGNSLVSTNIFINSKVFQDFFKNEDYPLASPGFAIESGGKSIYYLPDFKGISYIMIHRNSAGGSGSGVITIHRKWNDKWYWSKPHNECANFIKNLNFNWLEDAKLFKRRDVVDAQYEEFLLFTDDVELEPLITATIDIKTGKLQMSIKGMTGNWTVVIEEFFDKHIRKFAEDDLILAKNDKGRIVAIYPGYRLPEDPERPLVLEEEEQKDGKFEFIARNVANMKISRTQAMGGFYSLPGALVAINESKKVLLLPLVEVIKRSKDDGRKEPYKKLKQIQKIPIVDDVPAPQARIHKLLLAYYFILSSSYNSARELLNPASSLHQNEAFNDDEIGILNWIVGINSDALEVTALKLVAIIHLSINQSKFPLDYQNRSKEVNALIAKIEKADYVAQCAFNHLLSLRELSEKYYVYRIFPEVLRYPLFPQIFGNVNNFMAPINQSVEPFSPGIQISSVLADYELGKEVNLQTLAYYYTLDSKHHEKNKTAAMKRLMYKANYKTNFSEGLEMVLYCLLSDPTKFEHLKKLSLNSTTFIDELEKVRNLCISQYKNDFNAINQSQAMTKTDLSVLRTTMIRDLRRVSLQVASSPLNNLHLVTSVDVNIMKTLREDLEKMIKNQAAGGGMGPRLVTFNAEALKRSDVLKQLGTSIDEFIAEKGRSRLAEITLSSHPKLSSDFDGLNQHIKNRLEQFLYDQDKAVLDLNNLANSQAHSSAINSVISLMHRRKTKTFKSLYTCYLKEDSVACIQKKFPQLSLKACLQLKESAFLFFSRQILIDYFTMLKNTLEGFLAIEGPISVEDLTIFCDELAKIEKFNDRVKDPVIMNFEFRSGKYRLRTEQVDDIDSLTTIDPKTKLFQSIVIQRMMAAGKTLVLGTISIVKKARDQSKLSILVPPSSLYQSNTTAMQARTYQYFKKKGRNFSFPRFNLPVGDHAVLVKNYLKTVIDLMQDSMRTQNYMILSPDTLHSYLNSYIEVLLNAEDRWGADHYLHILCLYSEIYRIFKTRSSIILDEIDMTMDPRKELNFPTQETEPYNMIAAALLADIMEFLVFDQDIINAGLDIHSNNQASLTPANYLRCLDLILTYIENQLNDITKKSIWYKFIFEGTKHGETVAKIMDFLRNSSMEYERAWITNLHDTGNEVIANSLIIVKTQLHQYMEDSLKGTVNQNFGTAGKLRPEIKYAVPYVAANTPSPASVFADRWETLLKTLLMVSASPCSLEITKELITYSKKAISGESAGMKSLLLTTTYKNLKLVLPSSLDPILLDEKNNLQVEIIQNALSVRSPAAIRLLYGYYMNEVFRKMTFPTEQITSNALHMTSMFGSVQGYSGTIDNVNILPQCVIVDAYIDHEKNEKNNGGISLKLVRDCGDAVVPELSNDSFKKNAKEMVKDMLGLYGKDVIANVSSIIDTGAFFKNFKNRQVVEAVLTVSGDKFEAGLYYDEDSNQLEFVRKSGNSFTRGFLDTTDPDDITKATQADLSKRFTFYDQRHITGSDILQRKTAHALMTAGPRVLLRDILQGTLRMRQYMTSQKVHLVTTEASRKFYYNKINDTTSTTVKVSDILALGALNEDDKQAHENEKLAFAKIGVEVRAFVLDEISRILTSDKDPKNLVGEKAEIFGFVECAKGIFLRLISEAPLNWLHRKEMKNTADTLKAYAIVLLSPIENMLAAKNNESYNRFKLVKQRIKNMIDIARKTQKDSLLNYLKDQINSRVQTENGNEVQMQTLTLTLIDLNMDQLIDQINGSNPKKTHKYELLAELNNTMNDNDLDRENDHFVSFEELFRKQSSNKNNAIQSPLLNAALITKGKRIGITRDLIELIDVSSGGNKYPIFSKYTLEGSHLLVQNHNGNLKVLLISPKHASVIYEKWTTNPIVLSEFWLCDLSGIVKATTFPDSECGQDILKIVPEARYLIFDLLIFNGSLSQILMNPVLKNIYENEWLKADNFKERATFLLVRMKLLLEKDSIMFEDDDVDFSNLKKYAMGDKNPASKESTTDGYPKAEVEATFEGSVRTRLKLKAPAMTASGKLKNLKTDLNAEIAKIFHIIANAVAKVAAIINYGVSTDASIVDANDDLTAAPPVVISAETAKLVTGHPDDKAIIAAKPAAPAKPPVVLMADITFNNIRALNEPDLKAFTDPSIKTIIVDTSSLNDAFDVTNPDVEIEALSTVNVDSGDKTSLDEFIDDEPKPVADTNGGGGGGGGGGKKITDDDDDSDSGDDDELAKLLFGKGSGKKKGKGKGKGGSATSTSDSDSSNSSASSSSSVVVVTIIAVVAILGAVVGFLIYRRKNLKVKAAKTSDEKNIETAVTPTEKYEYINEKQ